MDQQAAARITDAVLPPINLRVGQRYIHPTDGIIEITAGAYRDPVYGRVSNFWYWTIVDSGEARNGYGGNWAVAP